MGLNDFYTAVGQDEDELRKQKEATAVFNLNNAYVVNPDDEAEKIRLQSATGMPANLMADKQVKDDAGRQAYLRGVSLTNAPATADFLTDPAKANVAKDDVPFLTKFEAGVKSLWNDVIKPTPSRAMVQYRQGAGGFNRFVGENVLQPFIDVLTTEGVKEKYGRSNFLTEQGKAMKAGADVAAKQIDAEHPLEPHSWSAGIASGLASTYFQAPLMAGGAILGGGNLALQTTLGMMGITTGGQTYGDRREKGFRTWSSAASAAWDATVEVGTELLPAKTLFDMLKPAAKQTLAKLALQTATFYGQEMVGESLATFLQTSNDRFMDKPDLNVAERVGKISDYISSGDAVTDWTDTLKAVFTQTTLMGGAGVGANRLQQGMLPKAEKDQKALIDTLTSAEASRLYARSPETFAEFAQRAGDHHGISAVYLQADRAIEGARKQGIPDEQIPAWAAQYGVSPEELTTAIQTDGKLKMDFGKVVTGFKADATLQALQSDLLVDPNGVTAAKTEEAAKAESEHLAHLNEMYQRDQAGKINQDDIAAWEQAILETPGLRGRVKPESLMPLIARANVLSSLTGMPAIDHLNRMLGSTGLQALKYNDFQAKKNTDETAKPLDIAAQNQFTQGNNPVATLKGDEIGPDLSLDNAVKVSHDYFKNNLQGKVVTREGFGDVRITGKGWHKVKRGLTTDLQKARLIPAIPQIIQNGEYYGREELYKPRKDDIVAFHFFVGMVDLNGKPVQAGVTVGEDSRGNLFYNLNHDTEALWDRLKAPRLPRLEARGAEPLAGEVVPPDGKNIAQTDENVNIQVVEPDKVLFQSGGQDPLAALSITDSGQNIVSLFEKADRSSFLHETGHIFLNDLRYVAETLGVQTGEWSKVKEWLGVGEDGVITREMHEKFADHFEMYLKNGQAPTIELRNAFRTFKRWLTAIYEAISSKRFLQREESVNPEVKDLFDHLLATEQEIQTAREQSALVAMLDEKLLNETGFTPEQIAEYRSIITQAEDSARERRDKHKLVGREDRVKGWRKQATEEAAKVPVYALTDILKGVGVSRKSITDQFGDDGIPASSPMFTKDGIGINEAVAEHGGQFGIGSAGEFVGLIRATPARQLWIQKRMAQLEAEWDNRQDTQEVIRTVSLRRQLEIESQWLATMAAKADTAHQKKQAEVEQKWKDAERNLAEAISIGVKDEQIRVLRAQAQQAKEEKASAFKTFKTTPWKSLRAWAVGVVGVVGSRTVGQMSVDRLAAESRKHRQQAIALARQGKWSDALYANEHARMTEALLTETYRALHQFKKMETHWKSIAKWTNDNKRVKVGEKFRDQINRLLQQYGIAKKEYDAAAPDLHSFASDLLADELGGAGAVLADWLGVQTGDYGKMPWSRLQELDDALAFLYGHGREEVEGRKMANGAKVLDFANTIVEKQEDIKNLSHLKADATRVGKMLQGVQKGYRKYFGHAAILRFIAQRMDGYANVGGKGTMGPAEQLVQNIFGAMARSNEMWAEISKRIEPQLKILTADGGRVFGDLFWPEKLQNSGRAWTKERVVVACLNMGNLSNLQRLRDGYGLTDEAIHALVGKLTGEEWKAIQEVWDTINTLWPKIADVHERLNFFRPKKIEAQQIQVHTADGQILHLDGGYYPVAYDKSLDIDIARWTEKDDILSSHEAVMQVPVAKSGATKARQDKVMRPLDLSLSVLGRHFNDMIRYITLSEAIRDADRVFRSKPLENRNLETIGREMQDMIRPALKHTIRPEAIKRGAFESWRVKASIFYMGYNAWTAIQNTTGLFPAMRQVGMTNYLTGIYHVASHPLESYRAMLEISSYMKLRDSNFERDAKRQMRDFKIHGLEINGKRYSYDDAQSLGFAGIRFIDTLVSLPGWWGRYNAEMEQHGDVQKSVEAADAAINRAIGSGLPIDQTEWTRHPFFSLLNPFMSFAAVQQEVLATEREAWKNGKISTGDFLYGQLMTWLMPAVMSTFLQGALMYGLVGALGGGDDKKKKGAMDYLTDLISYRLMGLPFVRDIYNAVIQGVEKKAPVTAARMTITEAWKMILQLGQRFGRVANDGSEKASKALAWTAAEVVSFMAGIPASRLYDKWMKGQRNIENGSGWWANHFVPQEKKK